MNYLVSNAALMATVKQQKQRIAELEAALNAVLPDSRRYRFIRDTPVYDTGLAICDMPEDRDDVTVLQGNPLDTVIDIAIWKYERNVELFDK